MCVCVSILCVCVSVSVCLRKAVLLIITAIIQFLHSICHSLACVPWSLSWSGNPNVILQHFPITGCLLPYHFKSVGSQRPACGPHPARDESSCGQRCLTRKETI